MRSILQSIIILTLAGAIGYWLYREIPPPSYWMRVEGPHGITQAKERITDEQIHDTCRRRAQMVLDDASEHLLNVPAWKTGDYYQAYQVVSQAMGMVRECEGLKHLTLENEEARRKLTPQY